MFQYRLLPSFCWTKSTGCSSSPDLAISALFPSLAEAKDPFSLILEGRKCLLQYASNTLEGSSIEPTSPIISLQFWRPESGENVYSSCRCCFLDLLEAQCFLPLFWGEAGRRALTVGILFATRKCPNPVFLEGNLLSTALLVPWPIPLGYNTTAQRGAYETTGMSLSWSVFYSSQR